VLLFSLLEVLLRFAFLRMRCGGQVSLERRALWLHRACRMITHRLSMQVTVAGALPPSGLIASNHLSYLDILFFASQMPCVFVSKAEVLSWPMFGILARCGGTIFVERGRGAVLDKVSGEIRAALEQGVPVVLFPEGTSTDGSTVLNFFPALFEAAIQTGAPVYPAAIAYEMDDGREVDLCYYGDITFGPHLLTALGHDGIHAQIVFARDATRYVDRKAAARETREQVVGYREALSAGDSA
jgi:1-acyl-sn-glycerol-3-phosphate acyltransferase